MVQRHLFIVVGPMTLSQKYYNCAKYFHQILVISHTFAIIFIHDCLVRDFPWLNEHFRVLFHCDYLCTIMSLKNWLWLLQFDSPQALSLSIKQSVSVLMKFIHSCFKSSPFLNPETMFWFFLRSPNDKGTKSPNSLKSILFIVSAVNFVLDKKGKFFKG